VPAMNHRKAGRDADQNSQSKPAQVKWYLHWRRRQVEELGKTVIVANVDFKNLVEKIVIKEVECPDGFDIDWFRKTQLNFEKATANREAFSEWGFARALQNSNCHPLKTELLMQSPNDEPRIPPVDLDDFK